MWPKFCDIAFGFLNSKDFQKLLTLVKMQMQLHLDLAPLHWNCMLWQYRLWSFQTGGTKLERFFPKNQHTQRKLLNFENWVSGEVSKLAIILVS